MLRLSSLALAVYPFVALGQASTSPRGDAPLAPIWIVLGFCIVAALIVLLVRGPRPRVHASARKGSRDERNP